MVYKPSYLCSTNPRIVQNNVHFNRYVMLLKDLVRTNWWQLLQKTKFDIDMGLQHTSENVNKMLLLISRMYLMVTNNLYVKVINRMYTKMTWNIYFFLYNKTVNVCIIFMWHMLYCCQYNSLKSYNIRGCMWDITHIKDVSIDMFAFLSNR